MIVSTPGGRVEVDHVQAGEANAHPLGSHGRRIIEAHALVVVVSTNQLNTLTTT